MSFTILTSPQTRSSFKDKYGSLTLKVNLVRAAILSPAQQIRTRQPITVSILERHRHVRVCLTLTFAPDGARTGRFMDSRMSSPRPFRYTAHASNVAGYRMSFAHSNRSGWRMVLGAVSGIETSSLRSSLGKGGQSGTDPGVTEPTLALGRGQAFIAGAARTTEPLPTRQASARFRPRTTTDSPALHPLHSSRSSPAFHRNSIGYMPGLRSFFPTAANSRDSQNSSCAPGKAKHRWSRGFARPRPAIWCDAPHITPDQSNSPRCFARAGGCRHACQ